MNRRRCLRAVGTALTASTVGFAGCATSNADPELYPKDPVRWIVPYEANDAAARIADRVRPVLAEELGVNVEVAPEPGDGGLRGTAALHAADADGYTIGSVPIPEVPVAWLYEEAAWEITDLRAVGTVGSATYVVVSQPGQVGAGEVGTLADAYESGDIDRLGVRRTGSATHACARILREELGADFENLVAYGGDDGVVEGIVSGSVPAGIVSAPAAVSGIADDELVPVATVTEPETDTDSLNVPALVNTVDDDAEAQQLLAYFGGADHAVFLPGDAPDPVAETLSNALREMTRDASVTLWGEQTGVDIGYRDPAVTDRLLDDALRRTERGVDLDAMRR